MTGPARVRLPDLGPLDRITCPADAVKALKRCGYRVTNTWTGAEWTVRAVSDHGHGAIMAVVTGDLYGGATVLRTGPRP